MSSRILLVCLLALAEPTSGQQASVKLGFLVGSERLKHDQSYRPGRQLLHAFNYGIAKVNQLYGQPADRPAGVSFRLEPLVAETFGNESESIKQTVRLITQHAVHFILGPQESCLVEPRVASVFDVAMVSHFCSPQPQSLALAKVPPQASWTFVQVKPPNWRIVARVVTLIGQLLDSYDHYPQQLVLLYIKEPVQGAPDKAPNAANRWQDGRPLVDEALQYKLVGELLEAELNELLVVSGRNKRKAVKQLNVLNWHTTFHYGYTKALFRRLVRRHLFRPEQQAANANQSTVRPSQSNRLPAHPESQRAPADGRAAIYIVVGRHSEHLGLLSALNEMDQLGVSHPEQPGLWLQSAVSAARSRRSLVVGVDIKPYDERDDSDRFLQGLLMDEDSNLMASRYTNYIGVVPSRPARMGEFLDDMRATLQASATLPSARPDAGQQPEAGNGTLDSLHLNSRLLQYIRLPAEAFHLFDSIMLLGSYLSDCLRRLPLDSCRAGRRAAAWFANRTYTSSLNDKLTGFDGQAQAEGFYTLVGRRATQEPAEPNSNPDDDFAGLIQVGRFGALDHQLQFQLEWDQVDAVWLPLWCRVTGSNQSQCLELAKSAGGRPPTLSVAGPDDGQHGPLATGPSLFVALILLALLCAYLAANGADLLGATGGCRLSSPSAGWFDEADERNFKRIANGLLLTPEVPVAQADSDGSAASVELHCYMFPFPSCRFVHWLVALHQLKEMMFQFHANYSNLREDVERREEPADSLRFCADGGPKVAGRLNVLAGIRQNKTTKSRAFFTAKHKATPTLRLLMNKYKSINGCLCNLSGLNHSALVQLFGVTLSYDNLGSGQNKSARLVLEQPARGTLRSALGQLEANLNNPNSFQVATFRRLLLAQLINDLLDGLEYLHESPVGFHGELRATTCMVSADWRLKLSGFHCLHMRRSLGEYEERINNLDQLINGLVYSSPEVISNHSRRATLTAKTLRLADVYSFGFIIYELLVGAEPWECLTQVGSARLLVERVKVDPSFRPPLSRLDGSTARTEPSFATAAESGDETSDKPPALITDLDILKELVRSCWSQSPDRRPQSVAHLREHLESSLNLLSRLATENGKTIAGFYTRLLEQHSRRALRDLQQERTRSLTYKFRLLPKQILAQLYSERPLCNQYYKCVGLCVFRFVLLPLDDQDPLDQLNDTIEQLDRLLATYHNHLHLVDSQVDSSLRYLLYSGDPLADPSRAKNSMYKHLQLLASFALQLIDLTNRRQSKFNGCIQVRCSLHCGPAIGGLIPKPNGGHSSDSSSHWLPRHVLMGDSLQLADLLETNSSVQRIQVSADFRAQLLGSSSKFQIDPGDIDSSQAYVMIKREARIQTKLFGDLETYWLLNGPRLSASQSIMLSSATN